MCGFYGLGKPHASNAKDRRAFFGLRLRLCYSTLESAGELCDMACMQPDSLILSSVTLAQQGVPLCTGLSLRADPGDLWAIRGDNGSGKSTLLRAIAGLHPVQSGSISYGEHVLHKHPGYPSCVLYMGHKRALRPQWSVRDNILYWAQLHGAPELLAPALHYFDLEPYADTVCGKLSAGWQERVALARLITQPAPLWLLDEPLTHLDEAGHALVESIIAARMEQGGIVLMTSHYPLSGEKIKEININNLY